MTAFSQPDLRPLPRPWWRPSYVLQSDYTAAFRAPDGRMLRVTVPRGLCVDGSTEWIALPLGLVPVCVLWLLGVSADGPHRAAAVVHDWLYAHRDAVRYEVRIRDDWAVHVGEIDRETADAAFLELCRAGGVLRWRAWIRWAVLRLVGWAWWAT